MAFQAYLDDSGTKGTGKILLVGGIFGTAEKLAALADDWDRELRARIPLPIRYFKCSEATSLKSEFYGWSQKNRDEKVRRLATVIDRDPTDLVMVFGGVDLAAHRQTETVVGKLKDSKKHPLNQPYLLALPTALLAIGMETYFRQQHLKIDEREKVEIVVDEQSVFRRDALVQYDEIRQLLPKWLSNLLPLQPTFRDDKDFVLLQAADLLMGNARMHVEKTNKWPQLQFEKLCASPFAKYQWAGPLGSMTAREIERRLGLPVNSLNVTVRRGGGAT